MDLFWKALAVALRANAALVAAVSFNLTTKNNIVRSHAKTKYEGTGVFFHEIETVPLPGADTDRVKVSSVLFHCVEATDLATAQIVRLVELMFDNDDVTVAFLDITNSDIHCSRSVIDEVRLVKQQEDLDTWSGVIEATFTWSYKPSP